MDLQNEVIRSVRLDATADLQKTKDWLNQVYADLVVEDEARLIDGTGTLTGGSSTYTLPAEVLRIREIRVTVSGTSNYGTPLAEARLDWILTARANGGDATGGDPAYYCLDGYTKLELYPTPASAQTILIDYVGLPTALSNDGDVPILQEPYGSMALKYGAMAEAANFLFGSADPSTQNYRTLYDTWRGKYRSHLRRRGGAHTKQIPVAGMTSSPPHDNSADVSAWY